MKKTFMIGVKVTELKTPKEKFLGLMFKENIKPAYIKTRFGIHTFFVKAPIDIIVMDNNYIARKIIKKVKPWRVVFWNPKYLHVLELPADNKITKHLGIGTKLKLENNC